jgi:hypothetical protein
MWLLAAYRVSFEGAEFAAVADCHVRADRLAELDMSQSIPKRPTLGILG